MGRASNRKKAQRQAGQKPQVDAATQQALLPRSSPADKTNFATHADSRGSLNRSGERPGFPHLMVFPP